MREKIGSIVEMLDKRELAINIHRKTDVSVATIHKIRWFWEKGKIDKPVDSYNKRYEQLID